MSSLIEMKKELNSHELEILKSELDRKRKSTGIAYALWFFLSFFGIHKFYQGKFLQSILYIIAPTLAFLTMGIGLYSFLIGDLETGGDIAGFGLFALIVYFVWWIIDLFTLHRQVEKVNQKIERKILNKLKK
tara:strand:- start:124 stop:519 length:396 start_codon:yes stop_codon:yes gene_type:complete